MNLFELITTFISVLALIISVISMTRTRRNSKKLIELEEIHAELSKKQIAQIELLEKEKKASSLNVQFEGSGDPKKLVISNSGPSSATNIRLCLTEDNNHNPLISGDYEEKLTYKLLHPGEQYHFLATFPISVSQRVYHVNLKWTNEDGSQTNRDYNVSL